MKKGVESRGAQAAQAKEATSTGAKVLEYLSEERRSRRRPGPKWASQIRRFLFCGLLEASRPGECRGWGYRGRGDLERDDLVVLQRDAARIARERRRTLAVAQVDVDR